MAVDEAARHRLFNKARELFGEEEATTLMAHLPPGGWPNLMTKQDALAIEQKLLELEARLKAHTLRTVLLANLSIVAVFNALLFTALKLS